jgi:DNA polymerase III delta subunit
MIIRQFRLLLQAREALDAGQRPEQTMSVHAFVAGKAATQARNFRLPQLEAVYHQLLDLDIASKTGRADLLTGIHQLIVQLAR